MINKETVEGGSCGWSWERHLEAMTIGGHWWNRDQEITVETIENLMLSIFLN